MESRSSWSWLQGQVASRARQGQGTGLWMTDTLHGSEERQPGIHSLSRQVSGAWALQTFITSGP